MSDPARIEEAVITDPPAVGAAAVHSVIRDVQRSVRARLWIEAALLALAALVGGLILVGFSGRLSPLAGRGALALGGIAALTVLLRFGAWRSQRLVGNPTRVARLLAERVPGVSFDLLAAIELERELQAKPAFSRSLATAFLHRTADRTGRLDFGEVLEPGRITRAVALVGGTVGALLLVVVFAADFWTGGWQSTWRSAQTQEGAGATEPITGELELTYRYPSHTGLMPRTVTATNGEISGPEGTEVLLKTRADRLVDAADIVPNGKRLPLAVAQNHRDLSGELILERSGTYAFVFRKGERVVARGPDAKLDVQADLPPQVVIETPAQEIEVNPGQRVTLGYRATDDYGITSLELVYHLPEATEDVRVPVKHDEGRVSRGQYVWGMDALHANPGDRITYYLEARDNDARAGPKKGASLVHVLRFYSADEHRRSAIAKVEALWDKLVLLLADRLEGPDRAQDKNVQLIAGQQPIDLAAMRLGSELAALAHELAAEHDAPRELGAGLLTVAQSLEPRVQMTSTARRIYLRHARSDPTDTLSGQQLTSSVVLEISELEHDILYLESLLNRQKVEALSDMATNLGRQKRELASLLEKYQQTHDAKLQEQILRQVQALRARMNELMRRMSEMAKGIRDEHFNAEAAQEMMKDRDLGDALSKIEELVRQGKAEEALKKLQELSFQMSKMLEGFEGSAASLEQQFPELSKKFGKFAGDLQKLAADQQRVSDKTREIRDRYRQALKDRLARKARELKEQLLKQAEQARKEYKQIDPMELNPEGEKTLEEAQAELESVRNSLNAGDFDLAAESAARADRAAQGLASQADQQRRLDEIFERSSDLQSQSRKMAEKLHAQGQKVSDLNRKLQQMFPSPGSMMSEQDRQELQKLSGEQQGLEQQARGLREQMNGMQQMAPVFGQDAMEQMDQVGQRMGDAERKMEARDPGRGFTEQRAALDQLSRFQKQMQQSQPGGAGGMPRPMPMSNGNEWGGSASTEKVEIPDADQYQAPKEFRKDLLDAMKQGTPEKYKDQVKRYYEELVK